MIYFMPICCANEMEAQYRLWLPRLPIARQEKLLRYKFVKDRWLCAAAYMLLLHALQSECGIAENQVKMEVEESGKPYLVSHPHIFFNLSHCDSGVVCGLSDAPIGIDIESIRKISPGVVKRVLTEAEQAILTRSKNPELTFTALWTLKESWLKATGYGLTYSIGQVEVIEISPMCYRIIKNGYIAVPSYFSQSVTISVCSSVLHEHDTRIITLLPSAMNK